MPQRLIPLPEVRRVPHDGGSHIEPPLSDYEGEEERIAWKTAVIALDTGKDIELSTGGYYEDGVEIPHSYSFRVGTNLHNMYGFTKAWAWLNGFWAGVRAHG